MSACEGGGHTGYIHSVETFGTLDGPGVRFVAFFAGCPMRCLYCHNPDTWQIRSGTPTTAEELLARALRNRPFYRTGGITATGGEPLVQLPFLTEWFTLAHDAGFTTCLDTSGILYDGSPAYERLLSVCDLVMLDIKHTDPDAHRALTGFDMAPVSAFLRRICRCGVPVRLRQVLVPGITFEDGQIRALARLAEEVCTLESVELLAYHDLAKEKYARLGYPYPLAHTPPLTETQLAHAYDILHREMKKSK